MASSGFFCVMPKVKLVLLDEVFAVHVAAPDIDAFVELTGSSVYSVSSTMTTIGSGSESLGSTSPPNPLPSGMFIMPFLT